METDDMNCTSINFDKYNPVLNTSNPRQQLHQVPGAAPGSTAVNPQPNVADPGVYGFIDQVLSDSRLSTNPFQTHQNSIADNQFYDTEGVHTDELYQSYQLESILQSYNPWGTGYVELSTCVKRRNLLFWSPCFLLLNATMQVLWYNLRLHIAA